MNALFVPKLRMLFNDFAYSCSPATVINGSLDLLLATGRDRGELGKTRKKVSKLAFGDF